MYSDTENGSATGCAGGTSALGVADQAVHAATQLATQSFGGTGWYTYKGKKSLYELIQRQIDESTREVSGEFTHLLGEGYDQLRSLDERVKKIDHLILQQAYSSDVIRRLMEVPGYGPLVSSAFVGAVGDGRAFKCGRDASARLGLVPKHSGTGGRQVLQKISKRGDKYVRKMLIHGARAVLRSASGKDDPLSQ